MDCIQFLSPIVFISVERTFDDVLRRSRIIKSTRKGVVYWVLPPVCFKLITTGDILVKLDSR